MRDHQGLLIAFVRGFVVVGTGLLLGVWVVAFMIVVMILSGCTSAPVKPEPLPVRQYVPVPAELTKRCTWPKSPPLKDVIEAARKRKTCLLQYEGQLEGIEGLK